MIAMVIISLSNWSRALCFEKELFQLHRSIVSYLPNGCLDQDEN